MIYVCVDLEATCWEIKGPISEVIEIGAVAVTDESKDFPVITTYQSFVKPIINPELSAFCTKLTGITQADVENMQPFKPAWAAFLNWLKLKVTPTPAEKTVMVSWGDYDRKQLVRECKANGTHFPFTAHMNLKDLVRRTYYPTITDFHQPSVAAKLGVSYDGPAHRALTDAKVVAKLLREVSNYLKAKTYTTGVSKAW